jgi:phage gpG-like protein
MPRGLEVRLEQRGSAAAALHLRELGERAADPRPAFDRIGNELRLAEAAWFESRGAGSWAPLSGDTEAQKSGQAPLVASGRLRASLTSRSAAKTTGTELRYGTEVPYARFHEYGGRSLPKRPPLVPASPRLRRMMQDEVRRHVVGQASR